VHSAAPSCSCASSTWHNRGARHIRVDSLVLFREVEIDAAAAHGGSLLIPCDCSETVSGIAPDEPQSADVRGFSGHLAPVTAILLSTYLTGLFVESRSGRTVAT